jgi:pyruvate kinase
MRKTKIVATIGPACDAPEQIRQMIKAGVNVFRFNMKHSEIEWHSERMERVEHACKELGTRVAILMDLQGPEVRIAEVPDQWQVVENGDTVRFCRPGGNGIVLDHPSVFEVLQKGQTVYADDGFLEFLVTKTTHEYAEAEVVEGGPIKPRKTVNFPGAHLDFAALVEKDLEQLTLTAKHHVDYVALSFVRRAEDVGILRQELSNLKVTSKIIAKIEHPEAIAHFDLILAASDGVMVARGDLGVEYPLEEVPGLQKMIVKRAREEGKPVIVATQMLESMISNPRPTRAEVSDVANAVYEGTDAVMLSAESATGSYPVTSSQNTGSYCGAGR